MTRYNVGSPDVEVSISDHGNYLLYNEIADELDGLINLIPKNLIVRCCEGGGPENLIGTLAISLSKLIEDRENLLGILYGKNRKSL